MAYRNRSNHPASLVILKLNKRPTLLISLRRENAEWEVRAA